VRYCGAEPVFVDVDPHTYNLGPDQVLDAVTERTRAVMAVHLFGRVADVPALQRGLPDDVAVIEDAACAAGGALAGRPAGSLGTFAAFSFHPRKSITTGEAACSPRATKSLRSGPRGFETTGRRSPRRIDIVAPPLTAWRRSTKWASTTA
jgi:perosamine synthetase